MSDTHCPQTNNLQAAEALRKGLEEQTKEGAEREKAVAAQVRE